MPKLDLLTRSQTIRDETAPGGNTAVEVGSLFVDLLESSVLPFDSAATYKAGERVRIADIEYDCLSLTTAGQSPTTHPAKWRAATVTTVAGVAQNDYRPVATHVLAQLLAEATDNPLPDLPVADTTTVGIARRATLEEQGEGLVQDAFSTPAGVYYLLNEFFTRFNGGGGGSTEPTAPEPDPTGTALVEGYRAGKSWTLTNAQVAAKVFANLNAYLQLLTEGSSQDVSNLLGIGSTGLFRFPLAALPQGNGEDTVSGSEWHDLPLGNYADNPQAPRRFLFGVLPASTGGTLDMVTVTLLFGPWSNVENQLTVTRIDAEFRNREGFQGRHELTGPSRDAAIEAYQQPDGRTFLYVYFATGFVVAAIKGHAIGGSSLDWSLSPVQGALPDGTPNNTLPPAGTRVYSTLINAPFWGFNGSQFDTIYPITSPATVSMGKARITNIDSVPGDLTTEQYREFSLIAHKDGDKKVYRIEGEGLRRFLGSQYGILGLSSELLGPQLNKPIANLTNAVGVGLSLVIPADTFVSPTNLGLTYAISPVPGGMSLSGTTLTGTPTLSGVYTITVRATDTNGLFAETSFTLTVLATNRAPIPPAVSDIAANTATSTVIVLPPFTDPDGDAITYGFSCQTNSITFDAFTRTVTVPPISAGSYWFQYKGMDASGASSFVQFNINVSAVSTPFTMIAPLFDCATKLLTIRTTGGDPGAAITYSIPGVTPATDVASHTIGFTDPNTTTVTLRATKAGQTVELVYNFREVCAPAGTLPAPIAPTFTPQTFIVGQTVSVPLPVWTPPAGGTITSIVYGGQSVPGLQAGGFIFAGSGQSFTPSSNLNGIPTTPGTYTITVTATASNGTQTTATWTITVVQALTGGIAIDNVTNPNRFQITAVLENGYLLVTHMNPPGYGRYKFDGSGTTPFPDTLVGRRFPANGQTSIIQWFAGTEPNDSQESGTVHLTFNIV